MRAAIILFMTLLCCASLFFLEQEQLCVAAPMFSCILIVVWLTYALSKKDGGIPVLDIGFVCAVATLVYSVVPLISFWANGFTFDSLSDARLAAYVLTPEEIGNFHWRHVVYLAALATSYLLFRKGSPIPTGGVEYLDRSQRHAILCLFALLWSYFIILWATTGFTMHYSYESDGNLEFTQLLSSMPLIVNQISVKLYGIFFLTKLALLFIVVQKCRSKSWRLVLLMWIVGEVVYTFELKGARSELVFFLVGAALMYHRLIAPLPLQFLLPAGALFFAFFTFMGIYRSQMGLDETMVAIGQTQGGFLGVGGEFEALFGTAYDVYQRVVLMGGELPWYIYINDVSSILPPRQLLPFEKVPASEWYLRLIGASGLGFGYMWGVITQSIVGLDWIELIIRGSLLGFALAKIHDWYARRQENFLANIVYIYLCIRVYYTFRDTTGALLTFIVWEVLPFCALFLMFKALFPSRIRQEIRHQAPGPVKDFSEVY
jgi:hypothetical protein